MSMGKGLWSSENDSFIFTCNVQTVPPYHFQLVFVVLHPTVKEFFVTQSQNWTNGHFLNLQSFSTNHDSWFQHTAELSSITWKRFVFLFIIVCSNCMPCSYFFLGGMNEWNFISRSAKATVYLKNCWYYVLVSKNFSKFFDRWIAELPRKVKNLNWNNSEANYM